MQVTDVRIHPVLSGNSLVGFASVILDGCMRLTGIGIHQKLDGSGWRLTYPTKKAGLHDTNVYHPITVEGTRLIEEAIFTVLKDVSSTNAGYGGPDA